MRANAENGISWAQIGWDPSLVSCKKLLFDTKHGIALSICMLYTPLALANWACFFPALNHWKALVMLFHTFSTNKFHMNAENANFAFLRKLINYERSRTSFSAYNLQIWFGIIRIVIQMLANVYDCVRTKTALQARKREVKGVLKRSPVSFNPNNL